MNTVALSAEHLFKTYGEGDTAVHALNDVSFSMNVGGDCGLARSFRCRQINIADHAGADSTAKFGNNIHCRYEGFR